jgi:putative addiction module component (TIGR02574 family)
MSELLVEISKLSVAHRIELVQAILSTIASDSKEEVSLTPEQIAILDKRSAEIASGAVQTVPWEHIQAKLVKRYGLHH